MRNNELGGRAVYNPRGRNAEDDLAACILQAATVFTMDGQVVWIADGKKTPVFRDAVIELCRRFIVTAHPVNRGTETEPNWVVEYRPFVPPELMVRNLVRESLPRRAPVVWPEAAPPPPPPPEVPLSDHPEHVAGRRTAAKWAERGSSTRLQQEIETGQHAAAKYRAAQGQPGGGSNPAA
jgi:hypothetical protein